MVQRFNTIRHLFERASRPAVAAALAASAAAMLALGSCTAEDPSSVRIDEPLTSAAAGEDIPTLTDLSIQTDADEAFDPRTVADEAQSALDAASSTSETNLFDATTGTSRVLDASEIPEIESAVAAFDNAGYEVGFVVYDLATRQGIGCNASDLFFSASTVKAPFVTYALQDVVDEGQASLGEEVFEDVILDGSGIMAGDDADVYDLKTVIANTIVHSDNTGYALLRERFDQESFEAWCADSGVDTAAWEGMWYPYYSARDLAKLWLNTGAYVVEGQGNADLCADILGQTNHSFLREALGSQHRVLSKPGYEIDTIWHEMSALNDAGFVHGDNGSYVVAILSNADYDDEYFTDNEALVIDLATAIDATHDRLLLKEAA